MSCRTRTARSISIVVALVSLAAPLAFGQLPESWSRPQEPFRIHGNTYYVGTGGLSAVLITSETGHVLIDGALPGSAEQIAENVRALGFELEDVALILNSHPHFDHAGGLADLQARSGARVAASARSAWVLRSGKVEPDDPQFGRLPQIPTIASVEEIEDGATLRAGSVAVTAHFTPGHTPGGTTWTWSSCEGELCLSVVYADSLSPVAAEGYRYTDPDRDPNGAALLEASFARIEALPCDVLISPHPEAVGLFERLARRKQGQPDAFRDAEACRSYVATSRERLAKRVDLEQRGS